VPGVAENVARIRERIDRAAERAGRDPDTVRLMAVTKTVPLERVREAIDAGVTLLGENRVQEAEAKYWHEEGRTDLRIELHMIGALQRNKARQAVRLFDLVQSADRISLVEALDRVAGEERPGSPFPVFVEVNTTGEAAKSGVAPSELRALARLLEGCRDLRGVGLMTVARFGADEKELRETFAGLHLMLEELKAEYGPHWRELSMGMSDDYEIAVEEGSTLVRLGRALFGARS
jgi:PLP dependent protein